MSVHRKLFKNKNYEITLNGFMLITINLEVQCTLSFFVDHKNFFKMIAKFSDFRGWVPTYESNDSDEC